jgi:hypothetical protein
VTISKDTTIASVHSESRLSPGKIYQTKWEQGSADTFNNASKKWNDTQGIVAAASTDPRWARHSSLLPLTSGLMCRIGVVVLVVLTAAGATRLRRSQNTIHQHLCLYCSTLPTLAAGLSHLTLSFTRSQPHHLAIVTKISWSTDTLHDREDACHHSKRGCDI